MEYLPNTRRLRVRRRWLPLCCPSATGAPSGWNADPALWEGWLHRQGVMAIAYGNLRNLGLLSCLPDDVVERMEHCYIDCQFNLDRSLATLRDVAGALRQAGIEFVLLKGPSVSIPLYPDPATRGGHDLDLLVHESDRAEAIRVLEAQGYRQDKSEAEYRAGATMTQRLLLPPANGLLPVEIHWDVVNSCTLRHSLGESFADAFTTAVEETRLGPGIRVLAPRLQFIHTCVHATHQHQLDRLVWLVDVLQMVRSNPYDAEEWVQAIQTSHGALSVQCAVYACLRKVKGLWPTQPVIDARALRPRGPVVRSMLGVLPTAALIVPESFLVRWQRKLFRVALRQERSS